MAKFCSMPEIFSISKTGTGTETDYAGGYTARQIDFLARLDAYEDAHKKVVDELRERFEALNCPRGCFKQWGRSSGAWVLPGFGPRPFFNPGMFPKGGIPGWIAGQGAEWYVAGAQSTTEPGVGITHRATVSVTVGLFYIGCVDEGPEMDRPELGEWSDFQWIRILRRDGVESIE